MKHARGTLFGRVIAAHMALVQEPTLQRQESRPATLVAVVLLWALLLGLYVVSA